MAVNRGPARPASKGKAKKKASSKATKDPKSRISKTKNKKVKGISLPQPKERKSKPMSGSGRRKGREYTDRELGLPDLNMITPIGVEKPKGKKKGKVFVDDPESMATILALINADKEGQIESKMIKARQMEQIRQARQAEAEKREAFKKDKLDEKKAEVKKARTRGAKKVGSIEANGEAVKITAPTKPKKRVTFG